MIETKEQIGIQAIIILYNPNVEQLKKNIDSVIGQVDHVFLIDNSTNGIDFLEIFVRHSLKLTYYNSKGNLGVAKAQNIGINLATQNDAEFILILDQDSVPSFDMVSKLKHDLLYLEGLSYKIAAIGPQSINVQTESPYKPRIRTFPHFVNENTSILKVQELISSGSLIRTVVFDSVGLMDEKLFIDGVDHEWCWRATNAGYSCAMSLNASLYHMLGEGDRKFVGVNIAITSSFRVYYQYRNYIYLCKKGYVPLYWKINNAIKYLIKAFYYPIFVSPRNVYLRNIFRGLRDGLLY